MVLINIDRLSETELKYIAEQENLDDYANLTRDEIIEALEDIYEEDETKSSEKAENAKFIKTLTDTESDVSELPGVSPLPKTYNTTEISCILRDANWAYAFWSLSEQDRAKLAESGDFHLVVRICLAENQDKNYDIDVDFEDSSWSIELPWAGEKYILYLIARYKNKDEKIAKSEIIKSPKSYFVSHSEELKNPDTWDVLVTSLVSNAGDTVSVLADEIIKSVRKADNE